ncbi:BofC C-terminal domain-containing protein [Radiobacillus sp. PE A8.2]|uniref:BofC C-terminal domain-containing protein n=1 Tax=Radiobacillus sp. PE A8.2 TaxID=3380349 RepID=UPI00388F34D8
MKRLLILFVLFVSLSVIFTSFWVFAKPVEQDEQSGQKQEVTMETKEAPEQVKDREPLELAVILQRHYMDGKIEETTHTETIWSMQDFWAYYDGWQLVDQKQGQIVFRQEIADISPYLKEKGYFGLKNGILTIFNGRPMQEQVIQSFYQIDTSELESYQAEQLQNGIKIDSKEVYEYVLEAYRGLAPSRSVSS